MDPIAEAQDMRKEVIAANPDKPPVDSARIASLLGIQIIEAENMPEDVRAILVRKRGWRKPQIIIDQDDNHNRQREAVAYMLGLYVYAVERGEEVFEYVDERVPRRARKTQSVMERFASDFAAELIMPKATLKRYGAHQTTPLMALDFGVSTEAMRDRQALA